MKIVETFEVLALIEAKASNKFTYYDGRSYQES